MTTASGSQNFNLFMKYCAAILKSQTSKSTEERTPDNYDIQLPVKFVEMALEESSPPAQAPQNDSGSPTQLEDFENLTPEEIADIRRLLKKEFFISDREAYWIENNYRWSPSWGRWGSDGSRMIQAENIKVKKPSISTGIGNAQEMCNKATAFYWMESADLNKNWGLEIIGSIFKYWTEAIGREPFIELGDFFAAAMSVKKKSATTIPEIVYGHKAIYAQVEKYLGERNPKPIELRYFRLHPLFEALITVLDEYVRVDSAFKSDENGLRYYDNFAPHQSILLVRTGKEDKLSAPISFEALKHEALPLARDDDMEGIDVIRVPLRTGVRFVASLLLREDAAHPELALANTAEAPNSPFSRWEKMTEEHERRSVLDAVEIDNVLRTSASVDVKTALLGKRWSQDPECKPELEFARHWV